MTILDREKNIIDHLVDVCEDGRDFYHTAANKVEDTNLVRLFRENANIRENIILNLQNYSRKQGYSIETDGTIEGKALKIFGELLASIKSNTDQEFVNRLEEAEDRSLEEFHKALAKETTPELREKIVGFVNELQYSHDRMKAMKEIMKAA